MAIQALATVLPVVYLATTLLYGMELAGPRAPHPQRPRQATCTLLVAIHAAYIGCLWARLGHLPASEPWITVSLLALAMLLVYLPVEILARTPNTGVFVIGSAFVLQLLASMFAPPLPFPSRFSESPFFVIHALTAIFAIAALLLSGFFGGLYLVLLREIRGHRFGMLFRKLPDLEQLSRLNRGSATLGFVLLTAGLNLGIWWAHSGAVEDFNYLDPKVLPIIILWLVFGLIGASRWLKVLSGRRAALMAVAAAALLILAMIIVFAPVSSFHGFH